jgi:hypothetical protein
VTANRRRALPSIVLAAVLASSAQVAVAQTSAGVGPRAASAIRVKELGGSSPGKPQPPISVDYRLSAFPVTGAPLIVTITASAEASLGGLALDVRAEPGLDLRLPPVPVAAAPGERAWEVSVTPLSAGRRYLTVLVTSGGGAAAQARSVVVAIDDGAGAQPARAFAARAERIHSLPAEESAPLAADQRAPLAAD